MKSKLQLIYAPEGYSRLENLSKQTNTGLHYSEIKEKYEFVKNAYFLFYQDFLPSLVLLENLAFPHPFITLFSPSHFSVRNKRPSKKKKVAKLNATCVYSLLAK